MKKIIFIFLLCFSVSLFANFPIECVGTTEITYVEPENWHKVVCTNPVEIDLADREIRCLQKEHSDSPIHFEDPDKEVYANNLILEYESRGETCQLKRIRLFGEVQVRTWETNDAGQILSQYALADQMTYTHEKQHLQLEAEKNSRVLYFDEIHNTQMSAPTVTILKNPESGKPQIRGDGEVRFIFKEEEVLKFKNHFSMRAHEPQ